MSRPRLRRVLRLAGLAVAAAVLVALASFTVLRVLGSRDLARSANRFEAIVGPLDFTAYAPEPVPDDRNAALPILQALDRLEAHEDPTWRAGLASLRQADHRPISRWSEEDWRLAGEVLDGVQDVLGPLERAGGRSGSSFQLDYAAGAEMEIPNLLLATEAADLLLARARLAWHEARPEDAATAVEALSTLGRALEGESPLIFQLVGNRTEILQFRAIQDGLATRRWGPEDRAVLRRLTATTRDRPRQRSLRSTLGAEGAFLYSLRPGGRFAGSFAEELPARRRVAYRWRGYGSVAGGLDYYARVMEAYPALTQEAMAQDRGPTSPPRDGVLGPLIPNLRPSLRKLKAAESLARLARTALELAADGAAAGELPTALPAPPPADPFLGAPAVYERAPDGSAILTLPGGEEVWDALRPAGLRGGDEAPLFTWLLAPPRSAR